MRNLIEALAAQGEAYAPRTGAARALLCMTLLVFAGAWMTGCTSENELYCDEDTPCNDAELSFCDLEAHECVAPPAGRCSVDGDCTEAEEPICDEGARECRGCADEEECAGGLVCAESGACVEPCESSAECDDELPICTDAGSCELCGVAGGDAACEDRDDERPYCVDESVCGACRDNLDCDGGTRVCDDESLECRPCEDHGECESEVCDLDGGTCVAEEDVVYVEADAENSSAECTFGAPCETIGEGVEAAGDTREYVLVRAGDYEERVEIDAQAELTLVGEQGAVVTPENTPAFEVRDQSEVRIEGLVVEGEGDASGEAIFCREQSTLELADMRIADHNGTGLESRDCTLTVEASEITGNDGGGIDASGGTLTVEASEITGNEGGGIDLSSASFTLQNNLIVDNGDGDSTVGGVRLDGSFADSSVFEFNTVANNIAGGVNARGVSCLTASGSLAFSSNIVYGNQGDQIDGEACTYSYSNIENGPSGDGNIDEDPEFVNDSDGDFRLQPESPCIEAADPGATLSRDFAGIERPQGERHDIGAYEFAP